MVPCPPEPIAAFTPEPNLALPQEVMESMQFLTHQNPASNQSWPSHQTTLPLRSPARVEARIVQPVNATASSQRVQQVVYKGAKIPLYEPTHLMQMNVKQLRKHANFLSYTLDGVLTESPVPLDDCSVAEWILTMQSQHLNPLLSAAPVEAASPANLSSLLRADDGLDASLSV